MTEKDINLLAVFEERILDLIKLCEANNRRIEELKTSLREKDEMIQQTKQLMESWQARYTNLLTARRLAEDKEAFQDARKRVNKLVREVDACIALLNE